jgi:hypothetical protein
MSLQLINGKGTVRQVMIQGLGAAMVQARMLLGATLILTLAGSAIARANILIANC